MLRLILVPLDGSELGEQALPLALRLAERERAELELVHVYESLAPYLVQGAPPIDPTLDIELRKGLTEQLETLAQRMRGSTNVPVKATVLDGVPAPTLVDYIATRHADLVVMATHGRGGLSRFWIGGVATELARGSSAPVLLVRPVEGAASNIPSAAFRHVLIPLDGSPVAEEAIEHAVAVAGERGVEFHLMSVLPPVDLLGTPRSLALPDESQYHDAAMSYLERLAGSLRARGFTVDFTSTRDRNPARAILETANASNADLIAVEARGRGGRKGLGGVASKLLQASTIPVLVHRPRVEASAEGNERAQAWAAGGKRG